MSVSLVRENVRELWENSKHKIRTTALPGLFCLKNGLISDLHLQDFNPEVIEHITKPNVALNQCSNSKIPKAETKFFSGMYVVCLNLWFESYCGFFSESTDAFVISANT